MSGPVASAVLILAGILGSSAAFARPADCLVQVDGQTLMDGRCDFDAGQDGGFRIEDSRFIAIVGITKPGFGFGNWSAKPDNRSSYTDFGDLRRNGACWQNARSNVCAWSVGQRPQAQLQQRPQPEFQQQPQFQQQRQPQPQLQQQPVAQPQRPAPAAPGGIRVQLVNRDQNCVVFLNDSGDMDCDATAREHPLSQFVMTAAGANAFNLMLPGNPSAGLSSCNIGVFHGQVNCSADLNEMRSPAARWSYSHAEDNARLLQNAGDSCILHIDDDKKFACPVAGGTPNDLWLVIDIAADRAGRPSSPAQLPQQPQFQQVQPQFQQPQGQPQFQQAARPQPQFQPPAPGGGRPQAFYVEEGLCVGYKGGRLDPGTKLELVQCGKPAQLRFRVDFSQGRVHVAGRPGLCVDMEPEGDPEIVIVPCNAATTAWRVGGKGEMVRDPGRNICWQVRGERDRNQFKPGRKIGIANCRGGAGQSFVLND